MAEKHDDQGTFMEELQQWCEEEIVKIEALRLHELTEGCPHKAAECDNLKDYLREQLLSIADSWE